MGAGVTGGSLAATSTFAGIFFPAKSSFLVSFLGMGAAAITPLGWIIGIGLATGGAYYGCLNAGCGQGYGFGPWREDIGRTTDSSR